MLTYTQKQFVEKMLTKYCVANDFTYSGEVKAAPYSIRDDIVKLIEEFVEDMRIEVEETAADEASEAVAELEGKITHLQQTIDQLESKKKPVPRETKNPVMSDKDFIESLNPMLCRDCNTELDAIFKPDGSGTLSGDYKCPGCGKEYTLHNYKK